MRNRPVHVLAAALLALAVVCCTPRDDEQPAAGGTAGTTSRAQVLANIPAFVGSELRDTTGSVDAERRSYVVHAPLDSAAAFYRRILPGMGWQSVGDRSAAGAIDLHYRKADAALWVQLRRMDPATIEYTLIGTVGPQMEGDTLRRR